MDQNDGEIIQQSKISKQSDHPFPIDELDPLLNAEKTVVFPHQNIKHFKNDASVENFKSVSSSDAKGQTNTLQGEAALIESQLPSFDADNVKEKCELSDTARGSLMVHQSYYGKFSFWFVMLSTLLVIAILAYTLVRLLRHCKKNQDRNRDYFFREQNYDEDQTPYYSNEGSEIDQLQNTIRETHQRRQF